MILKHQTKTKLKSLHFKINPHQSKLANLPKIILTGPPNWP